ncbi:integrator complex subunit 1 [Planococcus citri]|uniref:integrator complex subunit 1 n=1 Tax=Planococcus citri TaxID=170843 RepID=UPI0031F757E8
MDRGKTGTGRGSKSKTPQFPSDLYVLGPKGARNETGESKRPLPIPTKAGPSVSLADRKRLVGTAAACKPSISATVQPAKKPKLGGAILSRPESIPSATSTDTVKSWELLGVDIEAINLVPTIEAAKEKEEYDKITAILCGALKLLKAAKFKPDPVLTSGLLYLAKKWPSLFIKKTVFNALCSLLKKESLTLCKTKITVTNVVLLSNILYLTYRDAEHWPEIFFRLYTDDAVGQRIWVDNEQCKCFVDNIIASAKTIASPVLDLDSGTVLDSDDEVIDITGQNEYVVFPRYEETEIINMVNKTIKDQQGMSPNFLKFLSSMSGILKIRAEAAPKLESCFINLKLKRSAQELLMSVCVNCISNTQEDIDIIAQIVKIRLKTKDLSGFYLECIKKLIRAHRKNLSTILKQIVSNELFAVRNPNNMPMMLLLFQAEPSQFASILAKIYLEYLITREESLRSLRCLLREITKSLKVESAARKDKWEFSLHTFANGLMKRSKIEPKDSQCKERVFNAVADLITLCMFLVVLPLVRLEKKDPDQVVKIQTTVASIQSDAVQWFFKNAYNDYKPPTIDFVHALHKVVFMEPAEQYYKVDNWPEQDRASFIRYVTEVPLYQDTVLTILAMGLSKDYPLTYADALELVEQLVKRASALTFTSSIAVLPADKLELVDMLFNLSAYKHPQNIELPADYDPPNLAVSNLYWKSWIILLIYCAHVPNVFGTLAWDKYPTLRVLIEMCITNHFVFPQANDDLQFSALEKQKILEFENHLASSTITESTSLLLSQLITMDPMGAPRKPPSSVLDQLQLLNASHKIGHLLCRSRDPDFLLDIIKKQGSSQSLPWLADLVHNSEGSLSHLPVQCLCEFMLSSNEKSQGKYQQLLEHLQTVMLDENGDPKMVCEILDYFLRRLGARANKQHAVLGLKLLLSKFSEDEMEVDRLQAHREQILWILSKLPKIPHFPAAKPQIIFILREACLVENDPELITCFLTFLAQHAASSSSDLEELTALVLDMAQLIVERSIIMPAVLRSDDETDPFRDAALKSLLKIFHTYLNKVRESREDPIPVSEENADQILLISWPSGEEATLYNLVIYAIIILLTYGKQNLGSSERYYDTLINLWFPDSESAPKAYVDLESKKQKNDVAFIPDWLKIRMISSGITRLVDRALIDMEPGQLFLFSQYFGIPKKAKRKLLKALDDTIAKKKVTLSDFSVDETYMTQFVIQRKREISGKDVLAKTIKTFDLDISIPKSPPVNIDLTDTDVEFVDDPVTRLSDDEIEQIVENLHVNLRATFLSGSMKENRQKLLRVLSTESADCSKSLAIVIKTLQNFVLDEVYVNGLVNNFHYPSHVFRLLTTSCSEANAKSLGEICRTILACETASKKPKNPLVVILKTFLNKHRSSKTSSSSSQIHEKDTLKAFENCNVDQLERFGKKLVDSEMKHIHGDRTVVETVTSLITRTDRKYENSTGLFIDWLVQVEPEIIGSSLELQLEMLFSQKSDTWWRSTQTCRPYLLTLLTHHANWITLEQALSSLLTIEATKKYDATAVLEFLWALARNPRLWQGREKRTPKHQESVDVLSLTDEQLICVIEYIVLEVESYGFNEIGLSKMSNRLSQLVQCAIKSNDSKILMSIINHLNEVSKYSEIRQKICRNVIAHLYLRIPRIITLLGEMQLAIEFDEISKADRDSSIFDVMSHSVLTSFTTNTQTRDWPDRVQDLEIIIRKMAATHPRLLLRQIRILETSLRGRVHLEWPVFCSRNHLLLFQQIIGVLELLQPHLFSPEFFEPLQSIFDCYLNLFKNHGGKNDVAAVMNRFVIILQNFIRNDAKNAKIFLQDRSVLLRDLEVDYPCIGNLCIMISTLKDSSEDKDIIVASSAPHEIDPSQWSTIINSFKRNDPASVLHELDYASSRKPAIVEPILERLCDFLHDPSSYNRTKAHKLLVRCVEHNPNTAHRIVPAVFRCLHSENASIIEAACKRLPELIVCSQEYALPILRRLFSLVVRDGIDTVSCIKKTIGLLNLQSSC